VGRLKADGGIRGDPDEKNQTKCLKIFFRAPKLRKGGARKLASAVVTIKGKGSVWPQGGRAQRVRGWGDTGMRGGGNFR